MRVLMVHNRYGAVSGEELMVDRIVGLLRARGHEVETFYRDSADISNMPLGEVRAFFSGIYSYESRRSIRKVLNRFRPEIVQIQNLFPLISPAILPEIHAFGVPIVMRLANYRLVCPNGLLLSHHEVCHKCLGGREWWCFLRNCEHSMFKSLGYALRSMVARKAGFYSKHVTRYYAQTEFQKQMLLGQGFPPDRIDVIPNMLELPQINDQTALGEHVGFAGRLSPEKGVETFFAAANLCADIPFEVAGGTQKMPSAESLAPANVRVLGHLGAETLEVFNRKTRILVVPSLWYEGFPGVLLEAMLQGKPVICSRIGGLPEIVDDGKTGLLFEPGNAAELAGKIRYLWDRPELCREMGEAGRKKVLAEYNSERYYERLMTTYERGVTMCQS